MKRPRLLAALMLWACLPGVTHGADADAEVLRWVVYDLPPYFIYPHGRQPRSAEELGQGSIDGFLRELVSRLPQYRHEFVEASTPRMQALVASGQTLCSVLHARSTERLQWLYFTPIYLQQNTRDDVLHLVIRQDQLSSILAGRPADQPLSLAGLLRRPELRTLAAKDRVFNPRIDAQLQAAQVSRLAMGPAPTGRILELLRAGRIDYTIEVPRVVSHYLQQHADGPRLLTLPLAEAQMDREQEVLHASCSRTPAGRQRIEAIDEAVRRLAGDPHRDRWLQEWRSKALDANQSKALNTYFDQRGRGGPMIE